MFTMPNKAPKEGTFRLIEAMLLAVEDEVRFGLEDLDEPDFNPVYALHSIRRIVGLIRVKVRSVSPKTTSKNDGYLPLRGRHRKGVSRC